MIDNFGNFFELFRHLPFFQVVLRWWNKLKRDCRKLCACHIGTNVKRRATNECVHGHWQHLPACQLRYDQQLNARTVFAYECEQWLRFNVKQIRIDLLAWNCHWNERDIKSTSMKCDAMRCPCLAPMFYLSTLEMPHKWLLEHENCPQTAFFSNSHPT